MVKLIFVGSPLLDITAKCDSKTLGLFGLKRDNGIKAAEKHDALFEDLFKDSNSALSSGGSAQNSARVAKWALGEKADVSFVGCTGNDQFEKWLRDRLISDGVTPLYVHNSTLKTGVCACLITSADERSMIARHDAAATLSVEHLRSEQIQNHISKSDSIFIEGYFIGHSPDVVLELANQCSPSQIFSLSLSAEYICRDHTTILLKLMPRVDVLLGNEAELKAFAVALGAPPTITVENALLFLRQLKRASNKQSRITIVTRGSEPVMVDDGSNDFRTFAIPGNINMVDSVGCGDALAGAFLAVYTLTKNLNMSVETGICAATEIAQVKGCNLPSVKIFEPEKPS